uniref:C3/C5 convertase n=1 Tax=Danio rerio TaxID=7955 RepID=F1R886_DANRE|nr:complement factor B isoform X1 [Danio rerio]|eukprot:XP_021324426.1 complement factor B isoform X1 [Danio rerio]
MTSMECGLRLKWLILALICPLIAGAPSREGSCPEENLDIAGGSFTLSNGYSDGSYLQYICPDNHYPSISSRRCQFGVWTPKASSRKKAECKKITCPNPRVLENGEVAPYQERYYINDVTTYSCSSDYKFRGSKVRVCQPNGKWNGSTPICGRDSDHCPDPGVPPGSSRTGSIFNIDDEVTYHCDSPLTLIGSKVRKCLDDGQWSGTEPQCYADFTYDTAMEAAEAFGNSLTTTLTVQQGFEDDQHGKKISLDRGGKLDIYIAVDASDSIDPKDFGKAKKIIKTLIEKISYYEVSPNYEILMFATDVDQIVKMRDFKTNEKARNISKIFEDLDNFNYDKKGDRTGTNIAKLYLKILDSMSLEQVQNKEDFLQTQHVIIVFTDGQANMGGNPKPKVDLIKNLVIKNNASRENKLDLYVFGVGKDVKKEDMNGLVSEKKDERHFFKLPDLDEVQNTFDLMLDDSTVVGLCGMQQNYDGSNKRSAYPWLAQLSIAQSQISDCMGSLVTSRYILTAAHCFKEGDTPDKITVYLEKNTDVKVEKVFIHPNYSLTAKQSIGIKEFYDFDVALLQLKTPVKMSVNLRPICLPCTKETNRALKLSDSQGTCEKHEQILLSNELVDAAFTSKMDMEKRSPRKIRRITVKLGKYLDACVEDAKKAKGIEVADATEAVTKNFLCSGGNQPQRDDVSCKGESGGATHVDKYGRLIQIGVVSWGVKNLCSKAKLDAVSVSDSRDYHINLLRPDIQSFLKKHLENDKLGHTLTFLP